MTLRLLSRLCGGLAVAAGLAVLAGWAFGVAALTSPIPGAVPAPPFTGVAMILGGVALILHESGRGRVRRTALLPASVVAAIGLLMLAGHAGLVVGVDRWLFPERVVTQGGPYPHPGRMAEVSAVCFLLVAFAIGAKAVGLAARAAVAAATLALVLAGMGLLAFVFNARIYAAAGFSAMSLPTAAVLVTLAVGALAAEPLRGWPRRLTLDTPGGNLSRVLLPLGVLAPVGIGAAALIATREGYFSPDFRLAVVCVLTAAVIGAVVTWTAGRIDLFDKARQANRAAQLLAEERLLQSQKLATLIQLSHDAIIVWRPPGVVETWSDGAERLYGYTREEAVGRSLSELLTNCPGPSCDPAATLDEHGSWEGELTHRRKDGREVIVSSRLQRVVGEDGEHVLEVNRDITERKRVTRELEESRASLTTLVDTVDQMVWSTRPDGYHDFFNRFWYEFTGTAPGMTDGEDWSQWLHPDDRERTFARWRHSLETGEPYEIEYRFRTRSGQYRWYLARARPVRDASGRIIRWMGTGTDIHAQKEFGERFRLLYQAQHTAHLVLAPDFTIEEVSDLYLEVTMTRREDLLGKGLFDAFPENPEDPTATGERNVRASLERVLSKRAPDRLPVQKYDIRGPTGEYEARWWALLSTPVFGPDGEVRHILIQVEDLSNEMLERERAAEARAGEARLRAVADAIPGLVFETDPEGRNTYVNEQYRAYTGLPLEALLGDGWRQTFHPDDREPAFAGWLEARDSGRLFKTECRIRRADGVWRWFMLRMATLRDAEGRVQKGIGVCTDITDQREAFELQRTLLQEVSHRVKNSLALVSSVLNLQARTMEGAARRDLEEASSRVHAVARVHDQLWRGAGTREIDLKPFLCDLCKAVGTTAPRHSTVCDADSAIIGADMAVPIGLFVNELLTNAYKYAYPEGAEGEVRLSGTLAPDGRYRLEVSDSGRGLPPGFDLAAARKSLGMRVITSLAAQLGGELTAGAAEPGARFTLVFPLKAA